MQVIVGVAQFGPWRILRLGGEIDLATAPELRRALMAEIDAGRAQIALDLTDVALIDSTGYGVLLGAVRRTRAQGGDLALIAPPPRVADVMNLIGLDRVFLVFPEASHLPTDELLR